MASTPRMQYRNSLFYFLTQVVGITALVAWVAYAIQQSSVDMTVTRHFYDAAAHTFPLRHEAVIDTLGRVLVWLAPLGLAIAAGAGALLGYRVKAMAPARSVFWALFAIACLTPLVVAGLKHYTALPRPYDLAMFGGFAQLPATFWVEKGIQAGGALPSMHAAAGFLFVSLYFSGWALGSARLRWLGLAGGLAAGAVFGGFRVMQGAHFLSQTLWSLALVWLLCSIIFYPLIVTRSSKGGFDAADHSVGDIWTHLSLVQVRRRNTLTIYAVLLACLLPVLSSTWAADSLTQQSVEWVGLGLILVAIAGRCWCILYLGGHKGSRLIDQGPYSISRNPLYLFSMIAVTGIGAQSGSIILGPILVLFVYAVFSDVIDEEERLLRKVFGPEFDAYCRRVPRFGPHFSLWRSEEHLTVSTSGLANTLRDALPYLAALPLFELIEWGQGAGWLPVLIRLP
jgi:membrane-associated PAP2 superfamily phosphatase/protein-S-isoprenylcysteine O-methyltransferase Ste14